MFNLYYFIFQRLIWKAITVCFLWFHYWIIKERKAAKLENHSVSADWLFTQMIVPLLHMLTGAMFISCSVRFLNMCKPRTGWPTLIWILWKWDSKPAELAWWMVNADWLGSIWSEIFSQMKFITFQGCPIKQAVFLPGACSI